MATCQLQLPFVQIQNRAAAFPAPRADRSLWKQRAASLPSGLRPRSSNYGRGLTLIVSASRKESTSESQAQFPVPERDSLIAASADVGDNQLSRGDALAASIDDASQQRAGNLFQEVSQGLRKWLVPMAAAAVIMTGATLTAPAEAADALKTCACLLKGCRGEFVRCLGDVKCAANIACLQSCNDRPDETECQIGCGDLFGNSVVDEFNACAVTREGCVPQKPDENTYPVPAATAIVPSFPVDMFTGTWYITAGLNPTFDTFDCQRHVFRFDSDKNRLLAHLEWRVATPDGGFFTKQADQRFVQDPEKPGVLYNHDNEFLHYEDDWYILASQIENKKDDFIYVYYRGKNDAWDGYGGAVVYTRAKTLPASIKPRLQEASRGVNLNFDRDFKLTNNACGPLPSIFQRLEAKVEQGEQVLLADVRAIGKAEAELAQKLKKGLEEVERDEEFFLAQLGREEREILGAVEMGAKELGSLFQEALPLRRLR